MNILLNRMKHCQDAIGLPAVAIGIFMTAVLLLGAKSAAAQSCIQDVWKAHGNKNNLTCTANDVRIAFANNVRDLSGNPLGRCVSGSKFSFIADFHLHLTADTRYDIGMYLGIDGDSNKDGALTGVCSAHIIRPKDPLTSLGSNKFVQLDAAPDTCGDINAANNPQVITVKVENVLCHDTDGNGLLNLPNCTTWRQPGSNEVCTTPYDAYPGSPSKCNCDIAFEVPIVVETGTIQVTKDVTIPPNATLPEPGGEFTYTVGITSLASFTNITINRICDDKYGLIAKTATAQNCPAGTLGQISSTNCVLPVILGPGASYSCDFSAMATASVIDTVTVFGVDTSNNPVQGSDSAQVFVTDIPPTATVLKDLIGIQCATVNYKVKVNNTSPAEALLLTALSDNQFGDITRIQNSVVATSCQLPVGGQWIAKNGSFECGFSASFCGSSHTDTVTATLRDDESNTINPVSNALTVNVSAVVVP